MLNFGHTPFFYASSMRGKYKGKYKGKIGANIVSNIVPNLCQQVSTGVNRCQTGVKIVIIMFALAVEKSCICLSLFLSIPIAPARPLADPG